MSDTRAEWHAWRSQGIGASEVAGVIGESPWSSPWSIWASKVGLTRPDDAGTDSMQFGTDLEPVIAKWFHRETGLYIYGEQTWCAHAKYGWARATVDGFVNDYETVQSHEALGVFEAKYTADAPWTELPYHYWIQVQWQMFVTDVRHAWIACMHLPFGRPTFRVYEVERDDASIESLVMRCEAFWTDHVLSGDPPDTDAHAATSAALREVYGPESVEPPDAVDLDADAHQAVLMLRELKASAKEIDAEIVECENAVKAALGTHVEGWADGVRLVTWKPQTANRLDASALRADHPDLHAEYTRPTSSRVMRIDKPKESK